MDLSQKDWIAKQESDQDAIIIDVRTEEEWNFGVIDGAIEIDIYKGGEFLAKINKFDKSKNYFIYCKAGGRSAQACAVMNSLGFVNTYNLVGGILAWTGELVNK